MVNGSKRGVDGRDGLQDRADSGGGLDMLGLHPVLLELALVAVDSHAAAVHRADREAEQLEIGLVDAGIADDVHPQPSA